MMKFSLLRSFPTSCSFFAELTDEWLWEDKKLSFKEETLFYRLQLLNLSEVEVRFPFLSTVLTTLINAEPGIHSWCILIEANTRVQSYDTLFFISSISWPTWVLYPLYNIVVRNKSAWNAMSSYLKNRFLDKSSPFCFLFLLITHFIVYTIIIAVWIYCIKAYPVVVVSSTTKFCLKIV